MNKKLNDLFEDLETQRHDLLEVVKKSPEAFYTKPNETKWSVHEILAHLIAAEKLSLQYIAKKMQGIDAAGDTGWSEELKMSVLKLSQRLPLRFKAPSTVVAATPHYSNIDELLNDWDLTRANLKKLLDQIGDNQLKKKIYKHFVVGRLNITHAILFLKEHVNHHWPQINRLLK